MPDEEYTDPKRRRVKYRVHSQINAGVFPEVVLTMEGREFILDGNAARRIGSMLLFAAGSIQADASVVRALLSLGITEKDRSDVLNALNEHRQAFVKHDEQSMVKEGPIVQVVMTDIQIQQAEDMYRRLGEEVDRGAGDEGTPPVDQEPDAA